MITQVLQAHFRPEFLNRIDEIVVFHPLSREDIAQIVDIQLRRVSNCWLSVAFSWRSADAAREYLAEIGYDPDFGARPLKRAIQRELQDPLAMKILSGEFHEGDLIQVDRGGRRIDVYIGCRRRSGRILKPGDTHDHGACHRFYNKLSSSLTDSAAAPFLQL